jgi:caa(3)-type oxidase subunit IV
MKEIVQRHLRVAGALGLLLALTTAFAFVPAGAANWIVALAISFGMTGLMMLFFMQLRRGGPLLWLTSGVGFLWLSLLLVLVLMDYLSRHWPE